MNKRGTSLNSSNSISAKSSKSRYKNFSCALSPNKAGKTFAKPSSKIKKSYEEATVVQKNATNFDTKQIYDANFDINQAGRVVASIKQKQIDSYDELENYKRLTKKRNKRLAVRIVTFLLLLIIAPIVIFIGTIIIDKNSRHDFFGLNIYIIVSESMEPEIMVNDCVVLNKVKDVTTLKVGDDIGYINDKGAVVVHRIERILQKINGELEFETGGINNMSSDQKRVQFEQIVGKRIKTLPFLGKTIVFFRSPPGIVLFIVLFAGIMVGFYVAFRMSENIKYIENVG